MGLVRFFHELVHRGGGLDIKSAVDVNDRVPPFMLACIFSP